MLNVNMASFAAPVVNQRRFRYLLIGLLLLSFLLGLLVVPIERSNALNQFKTWDDGLWWAAITVTGVGYGDIVPVTFWGRMIGLILAVLGVLAYGLIIGMFASALEYTKEKYYRHRLEEQLTEIYDRLGRIEKHNSYVASRELEEEQGEAKKS